LSKIKTTFVACVLLAACALAAFGVAASAVAVQNTNSSGTQNTNTGGSGALGSSDRKFMTEAAVGGMAEVEMARVAVERASSEAVRDYARKMIEDHTRANEELMQLASSKGVQLPTAPDAKHQSMLTRLRGLSGAEFDREYVRQAGVKSHEKMLKLVQDHSRKGRDADSRAFATKMVPAVQMHLDMARQLNAGGGATGSHSGHNGNANRQQ
jgi:putative membrane protein